MGSPRHAAPLIIAPVRTRRDLVALFELTFRIYADDPAWVPPLIEERLAIFDRRKNPFFAHARVQAFLAWRDGRAVGSIAAIIDDRHNEIHHEQMGAFGFFEVEDDPEAAHLLLATAEIWVRQQGMTVMRGPLNFSLNAEAGMLVEGFATPPYVMMTHNPPRYNHYCESAGYRKAMDLYAYVADLDTILPDTPAKILRVAERAERRGTIRIRTANMRQFAAEVDRVKQVYNAAWEQNWGFVPMTDAEIDHLAFDLKPMLDPDLVALAETPDGTPVGVALVVPDLNQALLRSGGGRMFPFGLARFLWHRRRINRARLMILGVVPEYRSQGIESLLILHAARTAHRRGYRQMECSWTLETNHHINRIIERLGGVRSKTYRIYEKALV